MFKSIYFLTSFNMYKNSNDWASPFFPIVSARQQIERCLAGEHSRARNGISLGFRESQRSAIIKSQEFRDIVQHTLVGIVGDTWISRLVRAGDGNQRSRSLGAGTSDLQLMASGVELGARVRVGGVQSNDLVADEVVTRLQAGRDRVLVARVGNHKGGLS